MRGSIDSEVKAEATAKTPAAPKPFAEKAKAKAKASAAPKPVAKPKAHAKTKAKPAAAPSPGRPVHYLGAHMYSSSAMECFRVIFDPSVSRIDARISWKNDNATAWKKAVKAVKKDYA